MNSETEKNNQSLDAEFHLNQAFFYYYETEELDKALLECEKALEIDEHLVEAHNLRGILLEPLGYLFEARKAYQQAILFDPEFIEAKDNLAELEAELANEVHLITIATFSHPAEAYVRKTKLDVAGIWSFVADDNTITLNWLYSNAIGGVKLQVKAGDVEQADKLLREEKRDIAYNIAAEDDEDKCPNCHSMNIYYQEYNMRLVFGSWVLSWLFFTFFTGFSDSAFILPFFRRRWKCSDCDYEWKYEFLTEMSN